MASSSSALQSVGANLKTCHIIHRRIQDFVRGGKALLARASLFGGAIFCGEGGGKAPLAPLDPRMLSDQGSVNGTFHVLPARVNSSHKGVK